MTESVTFENENQEITGILHLPENPTKSLVILVPGFTQVKEGPDGIFIDLAEELVTNGIAALRFNFRFTTADYSEFHNMTISGEVSDLKTITSDMSKDYPNLGLLGESLGGTISILSYDHKIKSLVLWYPAIFFNVGHRYFTKEATEELERTGYIEDRKRSTGQSFKVGRGFVDELKNIDVVSKAKEISSSTLVVHGDNDTTVPFNHSKRLMNILQCEKKLEKIENSEHGWSNIGYKGRNSEAQKQAIKLTVGWFNRWLK